MKSLIAIKNAKIVLENELLKDAYLLIENDRIKKIGRGEIPEGAEEIDAKGLYVGPGLVDIHVHGGNGYMFDENPVKAAEYFLKKGTTTLLATLYYNLSKEEFLNAVKRVKKEMGKTGNIAGFYMEGPYMNPKYGAAPESNKWKGEIKKADYEEIVNEAGNLAKVWVVAPERDGIEEFVKDAKKVNPDAVISAGHSEASPLQIEKLKKYGLKLLTHCMDATGRPEPEFSGTRTCGPDEACFLDDDMYAEIICDSQAIHVNKELIKLIIKIKGKEKVILISDSFALEGKCPDRLSHITDLQFDENGDLCGSKLTLNVACRNVIKHTGCSICDAFLMASTNPAKLLGMDGEIGSISEGKLADLVFVDEEFNVEKVMLKGKTKG